MPFKCCVAQCSGINSSEISVFSFPKDETLKSLWIEAIQRKDLIWTESKRICQNHFRPEDILWHSSAFDEKTGRTITARLKRPRLKADALPVYFPTHVPYVPYKFLNTSKQKMSSNMVEDDDIEVIEELNTTKRPFVVHGSVVNAKKPRLELPSKPNLDAGKPVLVQLKLFNDITKLVNPETEKIFERHLNSLVASSTIESYAKKFAIIKSRIDKRMQRAQSLINYPTIARMNSPFFRPQNGLQPINTYSRSVIPNVIASNTVIRQQPQPQSLPQPQPTPPTSAKENTTVEGLQVVCTIAGKDEHDLPPSGPLKRLEPMVNDRVYAMKTDLFGIWSKAVITQMRDTTERTERIYRVKIESNNHKTVVKTVTAKQIAHYDPSDVRIPFGKRIIALYKPEDKSVKPVMYAGIVAEPPKSTNRYRYLVFFDDGFAQYIEHDGLRLVYDESKNVWEDIHPDTRDFVKSYCEQFPERPMLKLQKNQVIKTEYNSGWWFAKVVDIDASMVKMYFEAEKRYEWIYRGSTRLAPLFNELEKAKYNRLTGKVRRHNITTRKMDENQPYVEYTRNFDEIILDDSDGSDSEKKLEPPKPKNRNTARKSTAQVKKPANQDDLSDVKNVEGEIYTISLPSRQQLRYVKHTCGPSCREKEDIMKYNGENPLRIPMFMGWERHYKKFRQRSITSSILYRAPCGKTLRSLEEISTFLSVVSSQLTIDLFTFDPQLCPFQSFRVNKDEILWSTDDITEGKENIPIACVNCLTNERPVYVEYATERFPGKGVSLNLDEEFLCGCDCTDNCQDAQKCQCRQLTMSACINDTAAADAGYKHKRLTEPLVTGIYECNSRCKCGPSCGNRVVQNGIKIRLQMFRTARKGWGIRCLDDVDAGMFLCIYAGQLLTEQGADEDGHQFGDEYLAELDHIEVAEKVKEGYESDVPADSDVDVKPDDESTVREATDSDEESDISSLKSHSSSQNSNSIDSDPEYEGKINQSSSTTNYSTRSKIKNGEKKKHSSETKSGNSTDSDDSRSHAESKLSLEKGELPDLPESVNLETLMPVPLSPETVENLEDIEINRKPKLELEGCDTDNSEKKNGKLPGLNTKKSQSLSKQPLPPPSLRNPESKSFVSVRSYFNESYCYIMDAKSKGNIGRYLNHSCMPNSFVQNVFVDTHDLRFPTVAFFALDRIKAGSELTWDYNYEIGSVADKSLHCYCGSKICRGRLL